MESAHLVSYSTDMLLDAEHEQDVGPGGMTPLFLC